MGKVIAIDGPSGAGKSTVAKLLAQRLGFEYLDTGALYRAAALLFLIKGVKPEDDDEELMDALNSSNIRLEDRKVFLNGRDVTVEIRTPEIGHYSSVFSARKIVRDSLLGVQRDASLERNIVVEGRDTTTVVFPDAWKKFYVDASGMERKRRRYRQLKEAGIDVSEEGADNDIMERDKRDMARGIAPLVKAEDAIIIDTTDTSIEEVVDKILKIIRSDPCLR